MSEKQAFTESKPTRAHWPQASIGGYTVSTRNVLLIAAIILLVTAWRSSLAGPTGPTAPPATSFNHVFIVVEENTSYGRLIGNPAVPYLNGLARRYGLASNYYANTHPSMGNYFMMTTGRIISRSDAFTGVTSHNNIARILAHAGKTWRCYAESLPYAGYLGNDSGLYMRHHNPFVYFSDVIENPAQAANVVPFTQFARDLHGDSFPDYSFIVPNILNDAHSCADVHRGCPKDTRLATMDHWLEANIAPLVADPQFQKDGLLIITFDEASMVDSRHGGGHVAWVAVSGRSKPGYVSTELYQHQNTLSLMASSLGLTSLPGAAAMAFPMSEFFQ